MNCIATGCNTHFCYACGVCIIRSALSTEIQGAVSTHYSGACQMFDDPNADDEWDLAGSGRNFVGSQSGSENHLCNNIIV